MLPCRNINCLRFLVVRYALAKPSPRVCLARRAGWLCRESVREKRGHGCERCGVRGWCAHAPRGRRREAGRLVDSRPKPRVQAHRGQPSILSPRA